MTAHASCLHICENEFLFSICQLVFRSVTSNNLPNPQPSHPLPRIPNNAHPLFPLQAPSSRLPFLPPRLKPLQNLIHRNTPDRSTLPLREVEIPGCHEADEIFFVGDEGVGCESCFLGGWVRERRGLEEGLCEGAVAEGSWGDGREWRVLVLGFGFGRGF